MIDPFITFVIFADSLDDQDLLLTVNSIRQQTDMCWELDIKVFSVPDAPTISIFTHDNPRIIVTKRNDTERTSECRSTVISFLPRGVELFSSTCGDLKKEFTQNEVDIVLANIILFDNPHTDSKTKQSKPQSFITTIRRQDFLNDSILIREISLPVGKLNKDALAPVPSRNTKTSDHIQDKTIRAEYIYDLEQQNLVLSEQLRYLAPSADTMKLAEANLLLLRDRLAKAKEELQSIRNSRTWRVGRLILIPFRVFKRLTRPFINR